MKNQSIVIAGMAGTVAVSLAFMVGLIVVMANQGQPRTIGTRLSQPAVAAGGPTILVRRTDARVTGVSKDAALKIAGMVISALRGVVLMTGGSQTVVLELVASVMARPAVSAPAVASVETVR